MMRKPEHPPLTIEALVKWLQTQPPEKTYIWSDPVFCLMGNYLRDHNSAWGAATYSDLPGYEEIAKTEPWNFGAALERARTLALPPPTPEPTPVRWNTELFDGRKSHAEAKDQPSDRTHSTSLGGKTLPALPPPRS